MGREEFMELAWPPAAEGAALVNAMTVDVEEHFQVEALRRAYPPDSWQAQASRVVRNTERILELFAAHDVRATFFTLGWVARREPGLVRRIVAEGHELASHGLAHIRADEQDPETFREDVRTAKAVLEDAAGVRVRGYRAATFSISEANLWAYGILAETGFAYSSSVNPVRHDNYGMPEGPRFPFRPHPSHDITEIPISTVAVGRENLPCAGGGYFRLFPYAVTRWAVRRVHDRDRRPFNFYFHPWEIDSGQPRADDIPLLSRFRHYTNLDRMEHRLTRLLADFRWDRMDRVFAPAMDGALTNLPGLR